MQVWEFAHGQDSRLVEAPQARKSIGAQVYYGVRLDGDADADKFLDDLAGPTLIQTPSYPPSYIPMWPAWVCCLRCDIIQLCSTSDCGNV